jgi:hypothetical protein
MKKGQPQHTLRPTEPLGNIERRASHAAEARRTLRAHDTKARLDRPSQINRVYPHGSEERLVVGASFGNDQVIKLEHTENCCNIEERWGQLFGQIASQRNSGAI